MKVLHLCLANYYMDHYTYQENTLTKFHKKMGCDVSIVASLYSYDESGNPTYLKDEKPYVNEFGIPVQRLRYKAFLKPLQRKLRRYVGLFKQLEKEKPDVIFIHGCQFLDILKVVRYVKRHPQVKVYVDNHADFKNSAKGFVSKNLLHKILWRYCAKKVEPYTSKFFGVLPARCDFLVDVYHINSKKVELLVMGVDNDLVDEIHSTHSKEEFRSIFKIQDDDFLIVAGGRINQRREGILHLMDIVNSLENPSIKLIVFGAVIPELKERFEGLLSDRVFYAGWLNSIDTHKLMDASDLVVFPSVHSVMWEQAVGLGKPCVFQYLEGFTHVDLGGNCVFLQTEETDELKNVLMEVLNNQVLYQSMVQTAQQKKERFFYSKIAKQSLEMD